MYHAGEVSAQCASIIQSCRACCLDLHVPLPAMCWQKRMRLQAMTAGNLLC